MWPLRKSRGKWRQIKDAHVAGSEPPPVCSVSQSTAEQALGPWVSLQLRLPPCWISSPSGRGLYRCCHLGHVSVPLPAVANLPTGDGIWVVIPASVKLFGVGGWRKTSSQPGVLPSKGQYESVLLDGGRILG